MWWIVTGDTCKLRDQSVFSAFGLPDSLNYWKHWVPRKCYKQPVQITSSSWKLQVSDSQRSTSPDPSFVQVSFFFSLKENRTPVKEMKSAPANYLTWQKPSTHVNAFGESHRAQTGYHLQQRQESGARAANLRKLSPRCKPTTFSNGGIWLF